LPAGEVVKKLSLDDASKLGLKLETDEEVKVEGQASVKITSAWPTSVCVGEVSGLDLDNTKLIYKARIKNDTGGDALLEMWVHIDGRTFFSRGFSTIVKAKSDWTASETPFLLKEGQKADKVTLNVMMNAPGTVWVDDVVLEKAPLQEKE
jgi:hypothetical protein